MSKGAARSFTDASPWARRARIARRVESARAANVVLGARGTQIAPFTADADQALESLGRLEQIEARLGSAPVTVTRGMEESQQRSRPSATGNTEPHGRRQSAAECLLPNQFSRA
jgi:hypothetical protein